MKCTDMIFDFGEYMNLKAYKFMFGLIWSLLIEDCPDLSPPEWPCYF